MSCCWKGRSAAGILASSDCCGSATEEQRPTVFSLLLLLGTDTLTHYVHLFPMDILHRVVAKGRHRALLTLLAKPRDILRPATSGATMDPAILWAAKRGMPPCEETERKNLTDRNACHQMSPSTGGVGIVDTLYPLTWRAFFQDSQA